MNQTNLKLPYQGNNIYLDSNTLTVGATTYPVKHIVSINGPLLIETSKWVKGFVWLVAIVIYLHGLKPCLDEDVKLALIYSAVWVPIFLWLFRWWKKKLFILQISNSAGEWVNVFNAKDLNSVMEFRNILQAVLNYKNQ